MPKKSKHKEIDSYHKPFESPVVKWGYLDFKKQSNHTETLEEINIPKERLKYPVVERGYLDTIDQLNDTETQGEKKDSLYHKIIWSCVFVILILAGTFIFIPKDFGLFIILTIFLAMLLYRIIQK